MLALALDYQLRRRHVNNDRIRVLLVDEWTAIVLFHRWPNVFGVNCGSGKDNKQAGE